MFITKSLFVEFTDNPKLARRHINSKKDIYPQIMDHIYGAMDGAAIGQAVEDSVLDLFDDKNVLSVNTEKMRQSRHQTFHQRTMKVVQQQPDIVYQPGFVYQDVFVKCDLLVKNDEGRYDLIEVKAKNNIRKNTKEEPLKEKLIADLTIQRWVLERVLGEQFSGRCYIYHVNKEYVKEGEIVPQELIATEEVTDELMTDDRVEQILVTMRESLALSEQEFNARYPYDGTDHMIYFGKPAPTRSLRSVRRLGAAKRSELYHQEKLQLDQMSPTEIELMTNSKGEPTSASKFVELWQQGEEVIDYEQLQQQLDSLQYPLYFYDYETISWPIPLFDKTSPWQQVVVQYSLHKVLENGEIVHHEGLVQPGEESNERILQKMIDDMDGVEQGTRIVRYQGFENKRNTERGELFPDWQEPLARINESTFDLMEVFNQQHYFHRDFEGSASIKNVLPVMTDITYDGMAVPNGAVAADLLMKSITGQITGEQFEQTKRNLLEYCQQDTRAMVRIFQELEKKVK